MTDYRSLIDITYIEHSSNEEYRQEYLESFGGVFVPRSILGKDNDLEYGRRSCIESSNKKYIMLNDADDIYSPSAIVRAIDILEKDKEHRYAAVTAKEGIFYKQYANHIWSKNMREYVVTPEMLKRNIVSMHNFVVYRTDLLQKSIRDFTTAEKNYDYAFKKNFLSGDRLAFSMGEVGMLLRTRFDGNNWSGRKRLLSL